MNVLKSIAGPFIVLYLLNAAFGFSAFSFLSLSWIYYLYIIAMIILAVYDWQNSIKVTLRERIITVLFGAFLFVEFYKSGFLFDELKVTLPFFLLMMFSLVAGFIKLRQKTSSISKNE